MPDYKTHLFKLRQVLKRMKLDAFIIPQGDTWNREHPDPDENRFLYISGLDASAGYIVVTQEEAIVLIDRRYTKFAMDCLDPELFAIDYYTDIHPENWAIERLKPGQVIGYDSWVHTRREAKRMQITCKDAGVILQAEHNINPVDEIWQDRPEARLYNAVAHDLSYAGQSVEEKLTDICTLLKKNEVDSLIITADDSLAWLLNLRTTENSQSPGLRGFAILQCAQKKLTVFTDVDCTVFNGEQTHDFEVDFLPLEEFPMAVSYFERQEQIIQLSDQAPDWFTEHLNAPASDIITAPDPCELLKACKNKTEQEGIRRSHLRDARAVRSVIEWVKETSNISEIDVADKLLAERQRDSLFYGASFDSIVGWKGNGAKIHGHPTNTKIEGNGFLLIDSGGQYKDGTTDITRTIPIGEITQDMRFAYTRVLKGHISLAMAIFPEGTTGAQLDTLAREPLWIAGMDYAHGTGHGVGYFLNVHEGPCSISPRGTVPLREGMLLSNEPGYYKEDHFGIRLENLVLVRKYKDADDPDNHTGKKLLCFETVTKVKFEESCIIRDMIAPTKLAWLDDYHASCEEI